MKSQSSIQSHHWNPYRTELDDKIWISNSNRQQWFYSGGLITISFSQTIEIIVTPRSGLSKWKNAIKIPILQCLFVIIALQVLENTCNPWYFLKILCASWRILKNPKQPKIYTIFSKMLSFFCDRNFQRNSTHHKQK